MPRARRSGLAGEGRQERRGIDGGILPFDDGDRHPPLLVLWPGSEPHSVVSFRKVHRMHNALSSKRVFRLGVAFTLVAAVSLAGTGAAGADQPPDVCEDPEAFNGFILEAEGLVFNLIVGTSGNDTLNGTSGDDLIVGLGGNDTIRAGNGDDFVVGCAGNDSLFGENGSDIVDGGEGNDGIWGGNGNDEYLAGWKGDDHIWGGNGDDFLVGQQGEDVLHGDNGNDIAIGGPDNDMVYGDNGDDLLFGNFGDDSLYGGNGNDFLNGDLPFPADQSPAPPGAYEDPFSNTDSCDGGNGMDAETFCENQTSIEEHPDPSSVIFEE